MSRVRRKNNNSQSGAGGHSKRTKTLDLSWKNGQDDENIDSDAEEDRDYQEPALDSEEVEEEETLDAKKIRLARQYLQKLEAGDSDDETSSSSDDQDDDQEEDEHDKIGLKLQRERLKREGTLERAVADKVEKSITSFQTTIQMTSDSEKEAQEWIAAGHVKLLRGHDLTPTCVALQSNGEKAISGSKDHSVIIWDVERSQKAVTLCDTWKRKKEPESSRTNGEVLSVACSDDGRYAAVGKRDATVCIYDVRSGKNNLVKTFTGHKGAITSLCFRTQSLQLFSGSDDRCIRHYNLNEMMYVETLYGHQFGVSGVDCHRKERPISVGRDRTARAWKLTEDTHLIFRGGAKVSSADCLTVIKDDWYLTGHDDGHLSLWMTDKKKAVKTVEHAHGMDGIVGRGIVSVDSLRGSDLAATGSSDGYLRLWKVTTGQTLDSRGMELLNQVPIHGFVNDIAIGPKARFCVVAVGQEPRLGRWNRVARAKNRFGIVKLRGSDEEDASSDEENNEMSPESEEKSIDSEEDEE